jgi:hypothetical protein
VLNRFTGAEDQAILDVSFSRLGPYRCRWRDCNAVLNCADALHKHLDAHVNDREVRDPGPSMATELMKFSFSQGSHSYKCHWRDCTRRFGVLGSLEEHITTHAKTPIFCAYHGGGSRDLDNSFHSLFN